MEKSEKTKILKKFPILSIFYYWTLFVLFLPIKIDKLQYNMINSMGAMIFWIIKLAEIIKLIQYAIKHLENHKLWTNDLIFKNYTIFGNKKVWKTQMSHKISSQFNCD